MNFKTRHLLLILSTLFIFLFPSLSSANQTSTENTAPLLKEEITNLNSNIERYSLDSEIEAEKKATDINLDESEAEVQSEDTENNLIEGEEQTEDADNTLIEGEEQAEDKDNTLIEGEEQAEDKDNTLIEGEEQAEDKGNTLIEGEEQAEDKDNTLIEGEEQAEKSDSLSKTTTSKKESRTKNASSKSTTLKKGDRNNRVIQLKKDMNTLGIGRFPSNPSNIFGTVTEKRVKELQSYYGLKVNGLGDKVTLDFIKNTLESKFSTGNRGKHVVQLKKDMNTLGLGKFPEKPSQNYGKVTKKRVMELQSYYGLAINGIADKTTLDFIKNTLESKFSTGNRGEHVVQLKKDMNTLGLGRFPEKPSQNYGKVTKKRVMELQSYYGLAINGIADKTTLDFIKNTLDSKFSTGNRGEHVVQLKKDMNTLGLGRFPEKPSQNYGKVTKNRVMELQSYYGLAVNGIADKTTLDFIKNTLDTSLSKGKVGNNVVNLKLDLNKIGIVTFPSNPSKNFGKVTEKKLIQFQQHFGLIQNGIVDNVTASRIKKELNSIGNSIRIFIDPGHGGHDSGAVGYGLKEKDVVLNMALLLKNELESNYSNVEVMMSRSNDSFIKLEDRAKMANDWNADYFISLHNNSFPDSSARGFESYIHTSNTKNSSSAKLQDIIHDEIVKSNNLNDRGKKNANFSVLRNTKMPAILIEYLFISNKNENMLLKNPKQIQKLTKSTAKGLAKGLGLRRK